MAQMRLTGIPVDDLRRQKGRMMNILLTGGPWMPLIASNEIPISWCFIGVTFVSYFNDRTKLFRQYSKGFPGYFWAVFSVTLGAQLASSFLLGEEGLLVEVLALFIFCIPWSVYAFRLELALYNASEAVPN